MRGSISSPTQRQSQRVFQPVRALPLRFLFTANTHTPHKKQKQAKNKRTSKDPQQQKKPHQLYKIYFKLSMILIFYVV